jgi:hypothetical protein
MNSRVLDINFYRCKSRAKNVVGDILIGETSTQTPFNWSAAITIDDSKFHFPNGHGHISGTSDDRKKKFGESSIFTKSWMEFDIITKDCGADGEEQRNPQICVPCCLEVIRGLDVGYEVGKSYYFPKAGFGLRILKASIGPSRAEAMRNLKQWVHHPKAK